MFKKISIIVVVVMVLASSTYILNKVNTIEKHLISLTKQSAQSAIFEDEIETIPEIRIAKYGFSGVKRYIGEELFRAEPSANAAYVTRSRTDEKKVWSRHGDGRPLVEVFRVVHDTSFNGDQWALVCNAGTIGYVRLSDLTDAEPYSEYENVELDVKESLGGFHLGERIEKLIGTLDEEYELVHEQSEIYLFKQLDVLVTDSKRVHFLRTNSPDVKLGSGYKVSDLASEVLAHYESKYDYLEMSDYTRDSLGNIVFSISDNVVLAFSIDTKEVLPESIITEIRLHTLKPF